MKQTMRAVAVIFLLIALAVCGLTACGEEPITLKSLQGEYGVTVTGGGFEEGSQLVVKEIAPTADKGAEVLAALAEQSYR